MKRICAMGITILMIWSVVPHLVLAEDGNNSVNHAPEIVPGMEVQIGTASPRSVDATIPAMPYQADASLWFRDPDGSPLTYSSYSLGIYGRIIIDKTTGKLSFTPDRNDAVKELIINVTASDEYGKNVTLPVTVQVGKVPGQLDAQLLRPKIEVTYQKENQSEQVWFELNGNQLRRVDNITDPSNPPTYYRDVDNVILTGRFLSSLELGTTVLNFAFNGGQDQQLTIDVKEFPAGSQCAYTLISENGDIIYINQYIVGEKVYLKTFEDKDGRTFSGWFTQPSGRGEKWTADRPIERSMVLYAYWVNADGADNAALKSLTVNDGEVVYSPDLDENTFVYKMSISSQTKGLKLVAEPENPEANIYYGFINGMDGGYLESPEPPTFTPDQFTDDEELRLLIKCVSPDGLHSKEYSVISGDIRQAGRLEGAEYEWRATVEELGSRTALIRQNGEQSFQTELRAGTLSSVPDETRALITLEEGEQSQWFDLALYCGDDGNMTQTVQGNFPVRIEYKTPDMAPGKAYFGTDYRLYHIVDGKAEPIEILKSADDSFTFETTNYGRFVFCYNPMKYTMTFLVDNKEYTKIDNIEHGKKIRLPNAPSKNGYVFSGWFSRENGQGSQFTSETEVTYSQSVFAYWTKVPGKTSNPRKNTDGKSNSTITISGNDSLTKDIPNNTGDKKPYLVGDGDGRFRPNEPLIRAEIATIFARISDDFNADIAYDLEFSDIPPGQWYAPFVGFVAKIGLFQGKARGVFCPYDFVTRAELMAMVARYLKVEPRGTSGFSDCAGHWADGYIAALETEGIINGYEDGTFRPNVNVTRAEAVAIINRMRGCIKDALQLPYVSPFSDIQPDHWAYADVVLAVKSNTP